MAGLIKAQVQLGADATPTNNFMLDSSAANGTMKIARGNSGATTQDILTVDATGNVWFQGYGRVVHLTTNYTPVATDNNSLFVLDAPLTFTLPAVATLPAPYRVKLKQGALTGTLMNIAVSSTDTIAISGASVNTLKMAVLGDHLILESDPVAGKWQVVTDGIQGPNCIITFAGPAGGMTNGIPARMNLNSKASDPYNSYDAVTNFRFTPPVPGMYQISAQIYLAGAAANRATVLIYKNSAQYTYGQHSYSPNDGVYTVSTPVFLNGTTDYIEIWGIIIDANGSFGTALPSMLTCQRIK